MNPWVSIKQKEQFPQQVDVIFDLSESMKVHFDNSGILPVNLKIKIDTWCDRNGVDVDYYRLGNKITSLTKMDASDIMTDFTNLPDFMAYERPDQVLLITDGKVTVGREMNDLILPNAIPVHILGVGPIDTGDDLAIDRIKIPPRTISSDTVNLVFRMQSRLSKEVSTKLQILNEKGDNIFERIMSFKSGIQQDEIDVSIPAMDFSGLNTAVLYSIAGESQIENNSYSFRVNVQSSQDNILLISGALSPNTSSIKIILQSMDEVELTHYFRFDPIRWNQEPIEIMTHNPKIIVLDDFPMGNIDKSLFDEIVTISRKNQIPIVYLEGPKSNLSSGEIIRSYFPFFIPSAMDSDALTPLSDESLNLGTLGINLSSFPPQQRSVKWMSDEKNWVNYSDGSYLIAEKNNIFMIAMQDITGNHLKTRTNLVSPIYNIIEKVILHAYYGNEGYLSLHINGTSFNKGEVLNAQLIPINNLGLTNLTMAAIHSNSDTIMTDCKEEMLAGYYTCTFLLQSSGEYIFRGEAVLPDGKRVLSNETPVVVQDVNIELKELIQDQNALMRVAHNSGGLYVPIESLDSMFSHIEITPVQLIKNHQISGLSSQNYWWILIVLLAAEWFTRKKLGLL